MDLFVENMTRITEGGVVTILHWRANLIDGEFTATTYGEVHLPAPDPDEDFTQFTDITQAQANVWLRDALGDEEIARIKEFLSDQIEEQKQPKTAFGLPWKE